MNERESLLRAIHADRGNGLLKRQFADWLEEHGEGEMAEYIRLRCDRKVSEPSPRESELLKYLGGEVYGPPIEIRRDMPDGLSVESSVTFAQAPADPTLRRVFGAGRSDELTIRL